MAARLRYPELAPEGYAALSAFGHYVNTATALDAVLLGLVYLRASVLNGCKFCIEMHKAELRKHNEPESRIEAVAQEPGSDAFTPREQAALRWTEIVTRLEGHEIGNEAYAGVGRFFVGKDLVDLTFAIASINAWNRMGVAFQPEWRPRTAAASKPEDVKRPVEAQQERGAAGLQAAVAEGERQTATMNDDDGGKVGED